MSIIHSGRIDFKGGKYITESLGDWDVAPIFGFKTIFNPPVGVNPPLAMVKISFNKPIIEAYAILVTACRSEATPSLAANYGHVDETGFVVYLWETCADRTVQNGGFSFLVTVEGK